MVAAESLKTMAIANRMSGLRYFMFRRRDQGLLFRVVELAEEITRLSSRKVWAETV